MHRLGHDMKSCKLMQAQSKSVEFTLLTSCGGRAGRVQFQVAKKRPSEGQDLNDFVASKVSKVLNKNKHTNPVTTHYSGL